MVSSPRSIRRLERRLKLKMFCTGKLRSDSEEDWVEFRKKKAATRKIYIYRKRDYIVSKLDETKDNPKHFWKEIDQNLSFGINVKKTKHDSFSPINCLY